MESHGIEYYSHGDLLLADAGENKYVLDKLYGEYEIHHNTIAIADPRSPFPPSPWSGTEVRGIVKGNSNGLITPAAIYAVLSTPWIEFIDTHMTITQVFGDSYGDMRKLSSPVTYSRSILFRIPNTS